MVRDVERQAERAAEEPKAGRRMKTEPRVQAVWAKTCVNIRARASGLLF